MEKKREEESVTVAPFECAWRQDLRFAEAGRGCVAFDALAHNDVTVVLREHAGSRHYHYKRDNAAHYTVILGSHRNKRLRMEVDGRSVVDVEGLAPLSPSSFQSYWISIYDGLLSVGTGRHPSHNIVFQWVDRSPERPAVRHVGLSSWDKHVRYRNVNVHRLPHPNCTTLHHFLETSDFSDVSFLVGAHEKPVPAHRLLLALAGNFPPESVLHLPMTAYPLLRSLLQFIYTGRTQVLECDLASLLALSLQYEVVSLAKQCEVVIEEIKSKKDSFGCEESVELLYSVSSYKAFPFGFGFPIDKQRLKHMLQKTGKYSDVNVSIEGHALVYRPHKIILSLWSIPFLKMFTNGMSETNSSDVVLRDVSPEAFEAMLDFMYSGELNLQQGESVVLLFQLLLLADQFGVTPLHAQCSKTLLDCLSEDNVCSILQVVSLVRSCKLVEETCERKISMHFDYCTTASSDFVELDATSFGNILKHPDLTVTSEEKVVNAILMWGLKANEVCGWEAVDELISHSTPELLFGDRLNSVYDFLSFVRFPVMPIALLNKMEKSNISVCIPLFLCLIKEAISFAEGGSMVPLPELNQNVRFEYRRSSYKELQYICDGDSNGVLYYAGTSYGEHPWFNPVLAKTITITASSPPSRFTDPKVLASRTYQGTSFAGPRMEDGQSSTWCMVDIGSDHLLMCNYYTLRQDGSRAYMRYWNLQGSLDGKAWTDLRVHEKDQTVCKPGQFASWPIMGPNSLRPFRFFRVLLTGPTTDTSNPNNLCICFLELYGHFR